MLYKIANPVLLSILLLWLMPLISTGQPRSGHFVFKPISFEIVDSSQINAREASELFEAMKDDFCAEVYFNKVWVVAVQNKYGGNMKRMYNRKSRVLYTYFKTDERKKLSIDSIQVLKRKDKELLEAIDTLKLLIQIIEFPGETRSINGFECHRVTTAGFVYRPVVDEIWIAEFADVPDLLFPFELYFLVEGIPLEITQDFEDIKVKWGAVNMLPAKSNDDIFKQEMGGYLVSVEDTKALIHKCIQFVRTHPPKPD